MDRFPGTNNRSAAKFDATIPFNRRVDIAQYVKVAIAPRIIDFSPCIKSTNVVMKPPQRKWTTASRAFVPPVC
jgi:hypothetical protein